MIIAAVGTDCGHIEVSVRFNDNDKLMRSMLLDKQERTQWTQVKKKLWMIMI